MSLSFRKTLICTVGTSLLQNLRQKNAELINGSQNSRYQVMNLLLKQSADARFCGAEINSIESIVKKKLLAGNQCLYLLVSDTEEGHLTGDLLERYFRHLSCPIRFETVAIQVIEGLTGSSVHRFRTEGLRNLVKVIASIIRKHGNAQTLINATGGYKAQISFAGMIGQAFDIPVCYLFESFPEVIELPAQPISPDLTFWLANVNVFYDLAVDAALPEQIGQDPRFETLADTVVVDGQSLVGFSAVGQLFHENFCHRFQLYKKNMLPPESGIESAAKMIKYEDNNHGKHAGLSFFLDKLVVSTYVTRIYTHYYHPSLPSVIRFRRSSTGKTDQIEGTFSNGQATTRFDLVTTAQTPAQRDAILADMNERFQ